MLRTAFVRAAQVAARPVVALPARRFASSVAMRPSAVARVAVPRVVMGVRSYSAGGGLQKEEVEGRIMSLLQGFDKVNDAANIKPAAHFSNDLGLDSLDTVEVVMAIEEEFSIEIPDKEADAIHTVDQAVEYILKQPDAN